MTRAWMLFTILAAAPVTAPAADAAASAQRELLRVYAATPDVEHGAKLFESCAMCHGRSGEGMVAGTVPRIGGQYFRVIARQIVDFRAGRRWDLRMEEVIESHENLGAAQNIADVAAFVSRLSRGGVRGIGDGTLVETGSRLYAHACVSCHGAFGEGDERHEIPRIGGQHEGYVLRQIYDAVDARRPELTRTHRKRFVHLSFDELRGLSDYISRIGWIEEEELELP